MKISQGFFILFYIFTQTIIACDEPKDALKIRGRGRSGSFLDTYSSDSTPTHLALYKPPRLSKTGAFAAYNALLENTLQPSESLFPSFSAEMDHLQRCWDERHATNLSPDIRAEMGKRGFLLLHVPHIFKPKLHTQDSSGPKVSGFHHDPDRILEKSGLISITSETR